MKGRDLWWHEYRRRKFRQRRKVNIEMTLRDIFKKCFVEYARNSSIAGLRQMTDTNTAMTQRIVWLLVFCAMCGIGGYFYWYLWFGTLASPLIVNMQTSHYPISQIDFPAIAICNINIISKKALIELEMKMFKKNVSDNIRNSNTWQLGRLLDYSYNDTVKSFLQQNLHGDGSKFAHKVVSTMKQLAPKCEEMLLICTWAGKPVDCGNIFDFRRTNKGFCCTFNYVRNFTAAGMASKQIKEVKRQRYPGPLYGLNLIIDPLIEDYAYTTRNSYGVEILIFDPTHYADPNSGRVTQRLAEPSKSIHLSLSSVKQIATPEVRKYNVKTRRCLFHNERKKEYKNMYSYSACIFNCRVRTIHALCRCTPYAFPTVSDMPTCTLNELSCLDKFKEKLLLMYPIGAKNTEGLDREFKDSLYCPECMPDCEFTRHVTKGAKVLFRTTVKDIKNFKFYKGDLNMTNKCYVSIYQSSHHGVLDRLDVVSYWYELVSSVGGVAGILLGFSVISVFEVIYFFIFNFFILVLKLFFKRY